MLAPLLLIQSKTFTEQLLYVRNCVYNREQKKKKKDTFYFKEIGTMLEFFLFRKMILWRAGSSRQILIK